MATLASDGSQPPALTSLPNPPVPPPASAPPGTPITHVGKYTLYETIGEGAFGKVKLGINRETSERVAVKIMDKKEIREQDLSAQVRREIYIMRSLAHKHIVRMYEVLTSNTKLYIVMELVTGGELFDRLERHGRVDESLARQYFQQLVDGVDFCHKSGVAHRDLKPENLLVDANGDIKITDFGFSAMKSVDANAGLLYTQCGTPDYCAPEIIERADEGYNGAKVDVWSCGIILYALLVGRLPFREEQTDKLYDLILACQVAYPTFISADAQDLVSRLLVRNPAHRLPLAEIKRHPWFLVDYKGDDARALRKPAFYNKGGVPRRPAIPLSPVAASSSVCSTQLQFPSSPPPPVAQYPSSSTPPPPSPLASQPAPPLEEPAAFSTVETVNTPLVEAAAGPGRVAMLVRAHEKNSSPVDPTNPPTHAIFTRVQDRPATPASQQHRAAGRAIPVQQQPQPPVAVPDESALRYEDDESATISTGQADDEFERSSSTSSADSRLLAPVHAEPDVDPSEPDSVEDYQNRPVPFLNLPNTERFARHQTAQEIRVPHQQTSVQRHRSDANVRPAVRHQQMHQQQQQPAQQSQSTHPPSAPLPLLFGSLQPAPQQYARSGSPSGSTAVIGVRAGSPFRRPMGSTNGGLNGPSSGDLRGIILSNRGMRQQSDLSNQGSSPVLCSPSSPQHPLQQFAAKTSSFRSAGHALQGNTVPWHDNGSTDDMSWMGTLSDQLSMRMWNLMARWRSLAHEPTSHNALQELRLELRSIHSSMSTIAEAEEKLQVYTQFMSLFSKLALSDTSVEANILSSSANGTVSPSLFGVRSVAGSADLEMGGRGSGGMVSRMPTDMSSEDENVSYSPTIVYEGSRNKSDLARRRDMSDLLSRWIRRYSNNSNVAGGSGTGLSTRENSTDDGAFGGGASVCITGSDDGGISMDMAELQRLMRQNQGGRDDSNLADEFERLMRVSALGSGIGLANGNGVPGDGADSSPSPSPPVLSSSSQATMTTEWGRAGMNGGTNRRPAPAEYVPVSFANINGNGNGNGGGRVGRVGESQSQPLPQSQQQPMSLPASAIISHGPSTMSLSNSDINGVGTGRRGANRRNGTAASMGLDDVEYYGPDKRFMSVKVKGVLTQIKARNQRALETRTWFSSSQEPEVIIHILSTILHNMGARVALKKETKRKLKCQMPLHDDRVLFAGIELAVSEDGLTTVSFKRSRADRGRTDTLSFTTFYETTREQFIAEVQARCNRRGPRGSAAGGAGVKRKPVNRPLQEAPLEQQHLSYQMMTADTSVVVAAATAVLPSSAPDPAQSQSQPHLTKFFAQSARSSVRSTAGTNGPAAARMTPRAASDMR
jgi:serine/threonine protein kinase